MITEELYYDDGSALAVPVRHPNLSTQANVLPYKFMGNYVYELLIPITHVVYNEDVNLGFHGASFNKSVLVLKDPIILEASLIGKSTYVPLTLMKKSFDNSLMFIPTIQIAYNLQDYDFFKIVYTQYPKNESNMYDYKE